MGQFPGRVPGHVATTSNGAVFTNRERRYVAESYAWGYSCVSRRSSRPPLASWCCSSAAGASAQDAAEKPRRAGWYLGGGVGSNWASNITQSGWNWDPFCYPTDACFDLDPRPAGPGYRWHYDIAAATGPVFEVSAGFIAKRARVELAFGQKWNDLDQMFLSVTDYDGVAREDRIGSTVTSDTNSSIDHLAVRMLTVNAYYDFPAGSVVSPYLGAGVVFAALPGRPLISQIATSKPLRR